MTGSLFAEPRPLAKRLAALAQRGIFIGTSSWKYEGWLGSIYTPERYFTRGKFSQKKFDDTCLAEYAETFPVVCGDFSFYQFPSDEYWRKLFGSSPAARSLSALSMRALRSSSRPSASGSLRSRRTTSGGLAVCWNAA